MKIYHFDKATFQLIGEGVADKDPLEQDGWLHPAFSTQIAPGEHVEGKTIHFIDGGWVYQDIPQASQETDANGPEIDLVPKSVTRFQVRVALHNAGQLDEVESLMTAPDTPMRIKLAWCDSQEFPRDSATVQAIGLALDISSSQIDDLFIAASVITP